MFADSCVQSEVHTVEARKLEHHSPHALKVEYRESAGVHYQHKATTSGGPNALFLPARCWGAL